MDHRLGSYSRHAMADAAMGQGTAGMMPPNQGLPNMADGSAFTQVAAEQQGSINDGFRRQTFEQNARTQLPYKQTEMIGAQRDALNAKSDVDHKTQQGLNTLMSAIIEHDPRIESKGMHLSNLAHTKANDPEFDRRISDGSKLGTSLLG